MFLFVYFSRSDLCFHVIQNDIALDAESALNLFRQKQQSSSDLREVYARYGVTDVIVRILCIYAI